MTMQAPAADRVNLFVKHFANFVMSESERFAAGAVNQLGRRGFIKRVEQNVFRNIICRRLQLIEAEVLPSTAAIRRTSFV